MYLFYARNYYRILTLKWTFELDLHSKEARINQLDYVIKITWVDTEVALLYIIIIGVQTSRMLHLISFQNKNFLSDYIH